MIKLSTTEEQAEGQSYLNRFADRSTVALENVQPILDLEASGRFQYRGRWYVTPLVAYTPGIRLMQLQFRLQQLQPTGAEVTLEQLQQFKHLLDEFIALFKQVTRPVSWLRRLTWRWSRPFADITEQELGELIGFFSVCRMRSSIVFHDPAKRSPSAMSSSMPSTTLAPSSGTFLRGATRVGSQKVGGISPMV